MLPAAKWSGVDFRPAMSLAFTLTESTNLFTRDTSPFRQASNSSLNAPLEPQPPPLLPGLELSESGVEPELLTPPVVVDVELVLLLLLRAGVGMSGETGDSSGSPALSGSEPAGGDIGPSTVAEADPTGGGESELLRGGKERLCCCCWEERRDVAIFTTVPLATS